MRFRALVVVVLLGVLCSPSAGAEDDPFEGWSPDQVEAHRKKAASEISRKLRRWMTARKGLVYQCQRCHGRGKTVVHGVGRGASSRTITCPTCNGRGSCVSKSKFLRVFYDFRTPTFRGDPKQKALLERRFKSAQNAPDSTALDQVNRWKKVSIEVSGNHAVARYLLDPGRTESEHDLHWIEIDGDWWIIAEGLYVEPLEFHDYPEQAPETAPGKEPTSESPSPTPTDDESKDLSKLFEISNVSLRPSEEGTWKVIGMLKNKSDRRFRYVNVEVAFWKKSTLIDTATATIGTTVLDAGKSVTFSTYVYRDDKPVYDRIEAKVTEFREVQ